MERRALSGIMLTLLLTSMLTLAFSIQPVKASGTTYIRADGSIDPPTAPIQRDGAVYTFTGNIYETIMIERGNIVIDGANYTLQGNGDVNSVGFMVLRDYVTIKNTNVKGFWFGVDAIRVYGCVITQNNITANMLGMRFASWSSGHNITRNYIANNNNTGIKFSLDARHNNISENKIVSNLFGIVLDSYSSGNIITQNIFANNEYGMMITGASQNSIYHNNFLWNTYQVYNYQATNTWDDGYPSGGNHWSDYAGVDVYKGPNQDETASDGIGDTPYIIDSGNQDSYPLMQSYPWASHDIGITALTASKTVVGQGYNASINLMLLNYGNETEIFNVTVYANTTVIETKEVTLTSGNSTTVGFNWNTEDTSKGNYTISAYAWPVLGETYTTDNTCADGTILVTIPGDVNGDKAVEGKDIASLAKWFGKETGQLGYSPNLDINGDGMIEGKDMAIVAKNFGKEWT